MRRNVVITGIGPICSIANGPDEFFDALMNGRGSLGTIGALDAREYPSRLAGEVRGVKIRDCVPKSYRKATKVMCRDTELAVISARSAAIDAGLRTRGSDDDADGFEIDPARTGCQIGAGLIASDTEELSRAIVTSKGEGGIDLEAWGSDEGGGAGMNNLPPLWLLKYLPNMLACHVTIIHGCEGPSNTIMGGEAGALLSIGEGARVIERGSADLCFSGGAESRINPLGMIRASFSGRLAPTHDHEDGSQIVRPYDPNATGSILGEGGGMVILEDETQADKRGARVYAQVAGFGAGQMLPPIFPGVFDEPDPDPVDTGLVRAIRAALDDAGIIARSVDAIVPMGLGSKAFDDLEYGALSEVFADQLASIPMITLCPMVGDTLAAQGGLMVAAGALCLMNQRLPARLHAGFPRDGVVAHACEASDADLEYILVCTGSLGGQSAAVVLKRARKH